MNNNIWKIISIGTSGFIVYIFDKIWGNSIDWERIRLDWFGRIFTKEFSIIEILIFLIIAIAIYFFGKKYLYKKKAPKNNFSKLQLKIKQFNKMEFKDLKVLFRWKVKFELDGSPYISELTPYCSKHDGHVPILFVDGKCPDPQCDNAKKLLDFGKMESYFQSELIDRWEKMNNNGSKSIY